MAKQFTIKDFLKQFPDDDACLAHLMAVRYGAVLECLKCHKTGKFSLRDDEAFRVIFVGSCHQRRFEINLGITHFILARFITHKRGTLLDAKTKITH